MSVREDERQKNCSSRGLGIAAAAIGVGVGAALYYFFSKREEHPGDAGSTSGWGCEETHALFYEDEDSCSTISEHTTTDTSINDSIDTANRNSDFDDSNNYSADANNSSADPNSYLDDSNSSNDPNNYLDDSNSSDDPNNYLDETNNSIYSLDDSDNDIADPSNDSTSLNNSAEANISSTVSLNISSDSDYLLSSCPISDLTQSLDSSAFTEEDYDWMTVNSNMSHDMSNGSNYMPNVSNFMPNGPNNMPIGSNYMTNESNSGYNDGMRNAVGTDDWDVISSDVPNMSTSSPVWPTTYMISRFADYVSPGRRQVLYRPIMILLTPMENLPNRCFVVPCFLRLYYLFDIFIS